MGQLDSRAVQPHLLVQHAHEAVGPHVHGHVERAAEVRGVDLVVAVQVACESKRLKRLKPRDHFIIA
jgi:hypothetical protein